VPIIVAVKSNRNRFGRSNAVEKTISSLNGVVPRNCVSTEPLPSATDLHLGIEGHTHRPVDGFREVPPPDGRGSLGLWCDAFADSVEAEGIAAVVRKSSPDPVWRS